MEALCGADGRAMRERKMRHAKSASAADWLGSAFEMPLRVSTFVPASFSTVVRVLNPLIGPAGQKIRWSQLSAAVGLNLTGETSAEMLCRSYMAKMGERTRAELGTLDHKVSVALAEILSGHTATPERCFFGVWTGYSDLRDDLRGAPVVNLPPNREMYLLEGPVRAAAEDLGEFPFSRRSLRWWPDDRSWSVGNDIYADSVYVAASPGCISLMKEDPRIETVDVHRTDRVPGRGV